MRNKVSVLLLAVALVVVAPAGWTQSSSSATPATAHRCGPSPGRTSCRCWMTPARSSRIRAGSSSTSSGDIRRRQQDPENSALVGFAFYGDDSAMFLDDLARNRKP